jgi:phage terminase Nu1 subunit (DNA packaging protein)
MPNGHTVINPHVSSPSSTLELIFMSGNKRVVLSGAEMAYVLKVTQSQLSQWRRQEDDPIPNLGKDTSRSGHPVLFDGRSAVEWYLRRKIREKLLGNKNAGADVGTADVVDFHQEKTRLTKAQADSKELENQERQGKLAEIDVLKETLSITLNSVAAILDSIPAEMRRQCPHLSQADIDEIATVIAKVRNSIDGAELPLPDILNA